METLGIKLLSKLRSVVNHTFGYRYGLRATLRNSRNYAMGNGGLAGKPTLAHDSRGKEWVRNTWRECFRGLLKPKQFFRLPINFLRLYHYISAYRLCLRDYRFDDLKLVLRKI